MLVRLPDMHCHDMLQLATWLDWKGADCCDFGVRGAEGCCIWFRLAAAEGPQLSVLQAFQSHKAAGKLQS